MEVEMSRIIQELDNINYNDEINEIYEYDKKAQEMHEKMTSIHSEICELTNEIENLRLEESQGHKTLQSNAEELATLKAELEIEWSFLNTLPEVIKECKATCCSDFNQEAELTKNVCDNLMEYFGFKIEVVHVQPDVWRARFQFLEGGEILLDFHIGEKIFNLQSMTPIHPNFDDLRTYLYETQDVSGFMCHSRKYFLSK